MSVLAGLAALLSLWAPRLDATLVAPAAVAAAVSAAMFLLREIVVWIAGAARRYRSVRERRAYLLVERHGFALLRACDQLIETLSRFIRFSEARWYSDPLDPGLKNALHYQMTIVLALLRVMLTDTFFEFTGRKSESRKFGERAEDCYRALVFEAPIAESGQASPKASGVLRREDLELLGERALRRTRSGPATPTYADFMEHFVDLGVGPRAELAPILHFFAAAEKDGPRRIQAVTFLLALAALRAQLARMLKLPKRDRAGTVEVPSLEVLDEYTRARWRRLYASLSLKLKAEGPG